jgi:hypothetical protein
VQGDGNKQINVEELRQPVLEQARKRTIKIGTLLKLEASDSVTQLPFVKTGSIGRRIGRRFQNTAPT